MTDQLSLAQWLARLEKIHPQEIELGLSRVRAVAQRLSLLPPPCPVITVAGTNGKGSTVAVLEALSAAAGIRCGCSTSPHFLRFNERIRIDTKEAEDEEIVAAFEAIDRARGDVSLTYFEFATLAALWVFARRGVELAILEVGLGGRLDAVNIVDADVAVVTSIDLDHQHWLGADRSSIAREKLGILRAGKTAVIAEQQPPAGMREQARQTGANTKWLGEHFSLTPAGSLQLDGVQQPVALPELGGLLAQNVAAAAQGWVELGLSELTQAQLDQAIGHCDLAGRRQRLQVAGSDYILDVAHNPAAVHKLLELIELSTCKKRVIAIFSAMADKDLRAMITPLAGVVDAWFLADQPTLPRAAGAADTAALLREQGITMISTSKNLTQALRRAQSLSAEGDLIVVYGSFHTVAAVMRALDKDREKLR